MEAPNSGESVEFNEGEDVDGLYVIDPDSRLLSTFQTIQRNFLIKQKQTILNVKLEQEESNKTWKKTLDSLGDELYVLRTDMRSQKTLLENFNKQRLSVDSTIKLLERKIDEANERRANVTHKTSDEIQKLSTLKLKVDRSLGVIRDLRKYEGEQGESIKMSDIEKHAAKSRNKRALNEQEKRDLLLSALTREVFRLEDRAKQLAEQATATYDERQSLSDKLVTYSTDHKITNDGNKKIASALNDVLKSFEEASSIHRKMKNDLREAKKTYGTLLEMAKSYENGERKENENQIDLLVRLNRLKKERLALQKEYEDNMEMCDRLRGEQSKLMEMNDFEQQNLSQILFDQNLQQKEISKVLSTSKKISDKISEHEVEILNEIKQKDFDCKHFKQLSVEIKNIKMKNIEEEKLLVQAQNVLSKAILEMQQHRGTIERLEKCTEHRSGELAGREHILETFRTEMNRLQVEIKQEQLNFEMKSKHLDSISKDGGHFMSSQRELEKTQKAIDTIREDIEQVTSKWGEKQKFILKLMEKRNTMLNSIDATRVELTVLSINNSKLNRDYNSLTDEWDRCQRNISNLTTMLSTESRLFGENKNACHEMLNENEWNNCLQIADLQEKEMQYTRNSDQLKMIENELEDMNNDYLEKQRENISWQNRVREVKTIQNEIRRKSGDTSEIDEIKKELSLTKAKEDELNKILTKINSDLEMCLNKHNRVFINALNKEIRLRNKKNAEQSLKRRLQALQDNIKDIEETNQTLNNDMQNQQNTKMKIEIILMDSNEQLDRVNTDINNINEQIGNFDVLKLKNLHILNSKQSFSNNLEQVKKNKYKLAIKDDMERDAVFAVESKKNAELISVVEALRDDFPEFSVQLTCLTDELNHVHQ